MLKQIKRWALKEIAKKIFDDIGDFIDSEKLPLNERIKYLDEMSHIYKNKVFQNELKLLKHSLGLKIMTKLKTDDEFHVHRAVMYYLDEMKKRFEDSSKVSTFLKQSKK